ncbi:HIT family protein [Sphingomonas sp. G124]|uniref:HIT family protein n=1 Tax=Sphingomonas cremea TaxID=2904799 RepID=A0A9X1TXX5_9SPHN|nr:HIT family protein [Sphingomonas cremea]MCF2514267.1 HIT family protein [Sphingomonas cremea]
MVNDTIRKFGFPETLVRDYEYWVLLLRPAQVTLGSLVLATKDDATAFGNLPAGAHAELARISAEVEAALSAAVDYQRINYLMLMMVDPHVHFHIIPRYEGSRTFENLEIWDKGWPGPPDLKSAETMPEEVFHRLRQRIMQFWLLTY